MQAPSAGKPSHLRGFMRHPAGKCEKGSVCVDNRVEKIINAQEEQGISVQQLADMSGVSKSTIYRVVRGQSEPGTATLRLMEDALGIDAGAPETDAANDAEPHCCHNCRRSYRRQLAEKERWIRREFAVLLCLIVFICLLLVLDLCMPDVGWLRG